MTFLNLEIQTDWLAKNIRQAWIFQNPIKPLWNKRPKELRSENMESLSQLYKKVQIIEIVLKQLPNVGMVTIISQSLQTYDFKTKDSQKQNT